MDGFAYRSLLRVSPQKLTVDDVHQYCIRFSLKQGLWYLPGRQSFRRMREDMDIPISGGCACKAVRYEITKAPYGQANCHCRA